MAIPAAMEHINFMRRKLEKIQGFAEAIDCDVEHSRRQGFLLNEVDGLRADINNLVTELEAYDAHG